jgi:hypothetical protein
LPECSALDRSLHHGDHLCRAGNHWSIRRCAGADSAYDRCPGQTLLRAGGKHHAGSAGSIEATGANRLQTIIYAVIPQIIPPYISFTMYRWDINVRMSTIIGFVGGGGIGFLLQQNINLLNYRAASAQMLAIAMVVATDGLYQL